MRKFILISSEIAPSFLLMTVIFLVVCNSVFSTTNTWILVPVISGKFCIDMLPGDTSRTEKYTVAWNNPPCCGQCYQPRSIKWTVSGDGATIIGPDNGVSVDIQFTKGSDVRLTVTVGQSVSLCPEVPSSSGTSASKMIYVNQLISIQSPPDNTTYSLDSSSSEANIPVKANFIPTSRPMNWFIRFSFSLHYGNYHWPQSVDFTQYYWSSSSLESTASVNRLGRHEVFDFLWACPGQPADYTNNHSWPVMNINVNGLNPTKSTVANYLRDDRIRAIAWAESRMKPFAADYGQAGWPTDNPNSTAWGLMQIMEYWHSKESPLYKMQNDYWVSDYYKYVSNWRYAADEGTGMYDYTMGKLTSTQQAYPESKKKDMITYGYKYGWPTMQQKVWENIYLDDYVDDCNDYETNKPWN